MGNLILDPSMATLASILALVAGLVVWILIRRRRHRVFMPILRVVELDSKLLPKMTITPPPWFTFLCFLLSALVLCFLTLSPRERAYTPFEPNQTQLHIYFDMSHSVGKRGSIDHYVKEAESLVLSLEGKGKLTYSTSHKKEVYEFRSNEDMKRRLTEEGFHREGLKIGDSLRYHLETIGEVNLLLIVSDRNHFSWNDFNWDFLEDELDVRFVEYAGETPLMSNIFINQVTSISSPGSELSEWEVEIIRSGKSFDSKGSLRALYENEALYLGTWQIPKNRDKINLHVRWPSHKTDSFSRNHKKPIIWTIETESPNFGIIKDSFRTFFKGIKQEVLLVADHGGEQFLEDPAHHLNIALEIMGFKVNRLDRFPPKILSHLKTYPVKIVLAGIDRDIASQCRQIKETKDNPEFGGMRSQKSNSVTWVVPFSFDADWSIMCRCFARFTKMGNNPDFCTDIETRNQYIGVLKSVGAKQVGGDINNVLGAIAWHYKSLTENVEVLAFTQPLKPDLRIGLSYASLPQIVKALVSWQKLSFKEELGLANWPRIQSISESGYLSQTQLVSNIPAGENIINSLPDKALPTIWQPGPELQVRRSGNKKDQDNPLPWLNKILLAVLIITGLEAIYLCSRLLFSLSIKRKESVFLVFLLFSFDFAAEGNVILNTLDFKGQGMSANRLSREVASRTSIELSPKIKSADYFSKESLDEPWIWSRGLSSIAGSNGRLKDHIIYWIKRGGFLIIEQEFEEVSLEKLTLGNILHLRKNDGWKAIPPDHELMRSFHLLDSLPLCNSHVWRGFHYDGRLAILVIPGAFLPQLADQRVKSSCKETESHERLTRVFVNILMVALATDYKKDQIHLPEILKRLR